MFSIKKVRQTYWKLSGLISSRREEKYPEDFSKDEIEILNKVRPYTMTTDVRVISLIRAIDYIVDHDIRGDIVECGVWKGGSMMAASLALKRRGITDRTIYLFDTFEGMPPPTEHDRDYLGASAADSLAKQERDAQVWARAQIDEVKSNMGSSGYPQNRMRFIKGLVENTVPSEAPEEIAILRLDTDWYESTQHELKHLFPRLAPGGVLILDDYGHWAGARKAVDEYIASHRVPLLLCRIDMSGRIAIKSF